MKTTIKKFLAAVLLIATAMSLAACGPKSIYDSLADDGFAVRVRFDAGGAFVNNTQNVEIVEAYKAEDAITTSDGKVGIPLLDPADPLRGEAVFKLAKVDGTYNYFQIGWYRERTPVLDAEGNALDVFGEKISESKREAAYTYSGKWDFDKDVVDPDALADGEMTLYAAWAPFFTYEFYAQNESGTFEKIGSKQKLTLKIPTVSASSGRVSMNDFPKVSGKTFAAAYLDEALTEEILKDIDGRKLFVNAENGTALQTAVKIYVVFAEE